MRSMTGFGAGEAPLAEASVGPAGTCGKITIEIRAVNHRFLDVRVRGPSHLPDLTNAVESLARARRHRGRFDVSVRVDGAALAAVVIDRYRARAIYQELEKLRDELSPNADVPLSLLTAVPDLFVPTLDRHGEALSAALSAAFEAALA